MPLVKDENWEEEAAKWEDGKLDVSTASRDELNRYVQFKVIWYKELEILDQSLWETYQEDFKDFSVETFKTATSVYLQRMRDHLNLRGVWVNINHKHKALTQSLYETAQEEDQAEWTREMIDVVTDKYGATLSNCIQSYNVRGTLEERRQCSPQKLPSPKASQTPQTPLTTTVQEPYVSPQYTTVQIPIPTTAPAPTIPQPPVHIPGIPSYGRELATVIKLYTDDQKYAGTNESLDYKLTIFYNICNRARLPQEAYMDAFPTMLKGLALNHFFTSQLYNLSFSKACEHLRNFFEGPAFQRSNLIEWNSITLQTIMSENPDKKTSECLQLLITKLSEFQHSLAPSLQTVDFLYSKLVTACQGIPACRYAVSDPPDNLGLLVNKLQSSITAYEKEVEKQTQTQAYFTDRRYHKKGSNDNHDRNRNSYNHNPNQKPRCFVCNKEGCRSWKHSEEERENSKTKFKTKFMNRYKDRSNNPRQFDNRFQERFKQYLVDYEGDDDDGSEEEFNDMFNALVVDTDVDNFVSDLNQDTATYFTTYGEIEPNDATSTATILANRACNHAITTIDTADNTSLTAFDDDPFVYKAKTTSHYTSTKFMGVVIDTGASNRSTAGYGQFLAFQRTNDVQLDESTRGTVNVQFGIGSTSSIGSIKVDTPVGTVEFHVVKVDTPFLLCLKDMDILKVYFNNLENVLVAPGKKVPVVRRFGHPFLLWNTSLQAYIVESFDQNPCYLTDIELRQLHRRFGHPSVERLKRILDRAGHDDDSNRKTLEYITRYCSHCQKHGKSPGRFRFTLRDDANFNYCIIVDIMHIDGKPLLHIVDEGTRFQAGRWLQNISAKHTWDILRACWIDTYLGPPDIIAHDAGKNFISREFKQYAINMGTVTKSVPVEAHNSIGMVERYHGPLRRVYRIITSEIPEIDKEMALQMAFKAINDSAGPDGLVPTLLVFGAYPRMAESDAPSPTVTQRANAFKKAMGEVKKIRAERQVADALNTRNGPNTTAVHDLPLNAQVLVWREGNTGQSRGWTGPYNLLNVDGETCTVNLPGGPTNFRSTVVKPYLTDPYSQEKELPENTETVLTPEPASTETVLTPRLPFEREQIPEIEQPQDQPRRRGRPRKYSLHVNMADITIFLQDDNDYSQFKASRQKEITGLLEKGVFELIDPQEVPAGVRIFNSRFVDEIKNRGTDKAFEKSRLVVQAYNDHEKNVVLTQSPTIQRVSQRLILCIAAMIQGNGTHLYLRDISQACVQSLTKLNRDFYIRPPHELGVELGIGKDSILKVVKPLYGVPEAGNHWFTTYHAHHTKELKMNQSTYDPCLLWSNTRDYFGIVGLQTDDTLFLADKAFATAEQEHLEKAHFLAKEREQLTTNQPIKFNGCVIQLSQEGSVILTQERQCKNLNTVDPMKAISTTSSRGTIRKALTTKEQYAAQRARGAYIASMCQPEASFDLSFAAQVINPDKNNITALNKRLQWQIDNPSRGLNFVKLDIKTLRLFAFTDASFANNKDLSSQIGYVLALVDATDKANIVHWSSVKCKRVTRSVLASELYAMAHGFDIGAAVKSTIERLLQIELPLVLCTDSRSLYDCLVKLGTTQEKRLMIDVMCLRQSYERREIAEVKWIDGDSNPADAMTKAKASTSLRQLIDTNHLRLQTMEWVERTNNTKEK